MKAPHPNILKYFKHNPAIANHFPDKVIIDLKEPLKQFHQHVDLMDDFEHGIDVVLGEILLYIADLQYAENGLRALQEDFQIYFPNQDGKVIGEAAARLGGAVLDQFKQLRVYDEEGILPYKLGKDWQDDFSPMFVRRCREECD